MKKNTTKQGSTRVLIFKERGVWYGAALELNIVESGDDPREVILLLHEAISGYVKSARKAKLSTVLNQKPDAEYERMWKLAHTPKKGVTVKSPYKIYSSSEINLALV